MKNSLTDLQDVLFDQLDRLSEIEKDDDTLTFELNRSKAITSISKEIIDSKRLMLEVTKYADECNMPKKEMPENLRLEIQ